jgi:hypothetical protein
MGACTSLLRHELLFTTHSATTWSSGVAGMVEVSPMEGTMADLHDALRSKSANCVLGRQRQGIAAAAV